MNLALIILLIEFSWANFGTFASGIGLGGLILFLLKWKRYKNKDVSAVNKEDAETEKIKAEAYEVKAKADVTIVDSAFKLIQRLSDECDMTKKQLDKTQNDLNYAQQSLRDATNKLNEVQVELENEKRKNILMSEEIVKLRAEIDKYKINAS